MYKNSFIHYIVNLLEYAVSCFKKSQSAGQIQETELLEKLAQIDTPNYD